MPRKNSSPNLRSRSRSKSVGRKASVSARSSSRGCTAKNNEKVVTINSKESRYVDAERRFTPDKDQWDGKYEFGGTLGTLSFIIFSHTIIYYFYVCVTMFEGTLIYPGHAMLNGKRMDKVFFDYLAETARPTWRAFGIFWALLFFQYVLAVILPGVFVKGLPLASENGHRLTYRCNAVSAWYVLIITASILHYTQTFELNEWCRCYGEYLTAATISADFVSLCAFIAGLRRSIRMTPSFIYNFFKGSALNYRLPGNVDLKLFQECRNSWMLRMLLVVGCAMEQYHELGYITTNMAVILVVQFLYVNAVQKGEVCAPTTWDVFYEKFGWMLAYWNTCGPFLYSMQALYIQKVLKGDEYPRYVMVIMLVIVMIAYFLWDVVGSQKTRFCMRRNGVPMEIIRYRTFPLLSWRYLQNPRTLKSARGEILIDGFCRYGRKINYTSNIVMSFLLCSSCGFKSFIPFFYFFIIFIYLVHRAWRVEARCQAKYGKSWDEYKRIVPYLFIPYVY
ncbi:unnamed protein product [Phytomonas sp. Hart1]|nr:unnamed protein product [Phytomonas sp. Hart1]|eukprot:CCW66172.1 unnamed protein product [Phytomonas sp. isolate Hart1]